MNTMPQGTRRKQILRREKASGGPEQWMKKLTVSRYYIAQVYPSMHLGEKNLTERPTQANPTLLGHRMLVNI